MIGISPSKGDVTFGSLPPARAELVLLTAIVLAGVVLRCAWPSRMAVEHFDEGVYASNFWFGAEEDFRYPNRHLYAPPLLPWLVEWSIVFLGPSHLGSMLIPLLFGVLTIPLVWWVARRWFGSEAALAAAALAALSDIHILYSRTVLTDVPLCFWLLLAVYFVGETYRTAYIGWVLAAGIATGLAWSTKYNGWLPLAIGLAGLVPWLVLSKAKNRPARSYFLCWFWIAIVAGAVWSPAWYDLQLAGRGGYAAVAENHRGYLVGLAGWLDAFLQQVANHRHFDGWLSTAGVGFALLLPRGNEWLRAAGFAVLGAVCAALVGSSVLLGLSAAFGIAMQLWTVSSGTDPHAANQGGPDNNSTLPCWLLAAWFCGLFVSTPFYTPFPRLTLPWLMSAWLGTAAAIGWWTRRVQAHGANDRATAIGRSRLSSWSWVAVLLLVAVVVFWRTPQAAPKGVPGWQARNGLEAVAANIVQDARRSADLDRSTTVAEQQFDLPDFVVYVYAEPALVFHLSAADFRRPETHFVVQPVADLDFANSSTPRPPIPTFLVTRPHARRNQTLAEQLTKYRDRLLQIGTYHYVPSDLVLLNDTHPQELPDREAHAGEGDVYLYRLK